MDVNKGYKSLEISRKEADKVRHDINSVWHSRFKGMRFCRIETHSYQPDSPSFVYYFINNGFDDYLFVGKYNTPDRS